MGCDAPVDPVPLGVSIEFVARFRSDAVSFLNALTTGDVISTEQFDAMTTAEICERVILPMTATNQSPFQDAFLSSRDSNGKPYVAPATTFVSHAWKYKISEPFDVMEQHANMNAEAYFWFDLFVNNQHIAANLPQEWWKTTFRQCIRQIGTVLLVLSPWNDPIPMKRAWCLWEVMCALTQPSVKLCVCVPSTQLQALQVGVLKDTEVIWQALSDIRAENADAFKPSDKEMIFQTIKGSVGFASVDKQVKDQLRAWYIEQLCSIGQQAFDRGQPEDASLLNQVACVLRSFGFLNEALKFHEKCLDINISHFGADSEETSDSYNNIGSIYNSRNQFRKAIPYFEKDLAIQIRCKGELDFDVGTSYCNLGAAYQGCNDLEQSVQYFHKAVNIFTSTVGDHRNTANSLHGLARAALLQGDYPLALSLLQRCQVMRESLFGRFHPFMAATICTIGEVYMDQNRFEEAIQCFEEGLSIALTTLGEFDPNVVKLFSMLGEAQYKAENITQAEFYLSKAIKGFSVLLDGGRSDSIQLQREILTAQGIYHAMHSENAKALSCFESALALEGAADSKNGPASIYSQLEYRIGLVLQAMKRDEQASAHFRKCLEERSSRLNQDHPKVLEVSKLIRVVQDLAVGVCAVSAVCTASSFLDFF